MYNEEYLFQVEQAIQKLQSGERVVSIAYGDHVVRYGEVQIYENIYERDEKERTALHYAVDAKTVKLLVEKGVNVNAADVKGYTALHLAVTEKRLEIVRELIKSGANVNAEEYGNKCTPLHLACMVGEKEIVEELVKAGGEIEQADKFGMTAMDYAKNSEEIAEVLKKETDRIEKIFMKG